MNILQCPECGSKFDVSTFEPGSDFQCGNCRHVLTVPGGDGEVGGARTAGPRRKRPEGWGKVQDMGPVSVPGGKTGRKKAPVRAAPTPGAAPASRSKPRPKRAAAGPAAPARRGREPAEPPSRRRRGPEPRRSSSSNTPMLLGLASLGLVAIIVLIFFLASGGDETTDPGENGQTQAQNPQNQPLKIDPNDPEHWSYAKRRQEFRKMMLRAIDDDVELSVKRYRDAYDFTETYKMPREKKEALEAILKKDPQNEWANTKRGNKQFAYAHLEVDDTLAYERRDELLEAVEEGQEGKVWVTPERYDELIALQEEESEHIRLLKEDPRYRWTKNLIAGLRVHPAYSKWGFKVNEEFPPYLVFVQDTGRQVDQADIDRIVNRNGKIFSTLYRAWKDNLEPEVRKLPGQADFTLPELGAGAADSAGQIPPILQIYVFANQKSWHEYQRIINRPLPPGVGGYYRRDDRWISLFEGSGSHAQWWGKQNFNNGKTFHEGAHQLHHYWTVLVTNRTNAKMGDPLVTFSDVNWRSHWFTEGWAEIFGAADEVVENEKWECFAIHHSRVAEYRRALAMNMPGTNTKLAWTLEQVVKIGQNPALARAAQRRSFNPRIQQTLTSLFYAQAWTFNHWLWFAEGGKYRKYLAQYALSELNSKSGYKYWEAIFKPVLDAEGGWAGVEKKVLAYLNSMPNVRPTPNRPR